MITSAQQSIARQRDALAIFLEAPLMELASVCARVWDDTDALEDALRVGLTALPYCDATGETGWKARRLPERTFRLAGPAIDRPSLRRIPGLAAKVHRWQSIDWQQLGAA